MWQACHDSTVLRRPNVSAFLASSLDSTNEMTRFWGTMMGEAGAGPKPVPYKELTVEKLAEGIKYCLTEEAKQAAEKVAKDIEKEGDGSKNAVTSFHRSLVLRGQHSMRCSILENRVAVWTLKGTSLRLSALSADLLVEKKKITWKQLRLIRHNEWNDFEGPGEPLSGGATAIMGTVTGIATGVGSVPFKIVKSSRRRAKHDEKKRRKSEEARRKSHDSGQNGNTAAGLSAGKDSRSKVPNGHIVSGNDNTQMNEESRGRVNEPPIAPESKRRRGDSLDDQSPSGGIEKVTSNPGLCNHTETGEPMAQKISANQEAQHQHDDDEDSVISDDPAGNAAEEIGKNVGSGVGKTAGFIAKAPMDLTLAVAQGFHNAPRLYGDTTVRR